MKSVGMFSLISLVGVFISGSIHAADRYVATTGSDSANTCLVALLPCLTVQYAIDQSIAGDSIHIEAGTYTVTGLINVNKTVSLLGAQAGIDARTRAGAETILSNTQGISVSADDVVFDGLTIKDSSISVFTGYGVWLNPGINGTQIINNIFQNNIVGLGLANEGTSQALIEHNLFVDNNLGGGAGGTGIYTDQYVGGAVSNVLINENLFENNDNAAIGLSNTDTDVPNSLITITNNEINNCGRGIYLFNTESSIIIDNDITNLSTPTDSGSSVGIGIYGAVNELDVQGNNIENGVKYGIRIGDFLGAANEDIFIHGNNIFGFALAGMHVENAPIGAVDYATCNWWGDASGPTNPILNPDGTGDVVSGDVVLANFDPWLVDPAPDGLCEQAPSLIKSFSPDIIYKGEHSFLTITLSNPNNTVATMATPLIDEIPTSIKILGKASTTCGGIISTNKVLSRITLTGGSIPPNGSCTIEVKVTSLIIGSYTNVIPAGALETDKGENLEPAEALLTVLNYVERASQL